MPDSQATDNCYSCLSLDPAGPRPGPQRITTREEPVIELERYHPAAEFLSGEGCYINELRNSGDDAACSIARARLEPGVTTRLHSLVDTVERYVILSGNGSMKLGAQAVIRLAPFDVVHIPAGEPQQISNTGSEDLVFLCICTPRFRMENYRDLDDGSWAGANP